MREEKYQPKMPDIMEAIFDAGYLIQQQQFYFSPMQKEIRYLFFMEY